MNPLRWSLPTQVFVAMALGIGCGLFFGEYCAVLNPLGQAFVMLLQMTVLPYIPCALIEGFGRLSPEEALRLFRRGWLIVVMLWGVTLAIIFCMAAMFPTPLAHPTAGPRFDAAQFEQNFLGLLIPDNPIRAMSENVVSAVAVFGVFVGVALMRVPGKEAMLNPLGSLNQALLGILRWIASISPIGVFALLASAAGSVRFETLKQINLYVLAYIIGTTLLTFLLLPAILRSVTGIRARDFLREMGAGLLLAFTTGLPSVTLPHIERGVERFAQSRAITVDDELMRTTRTLLPLAYSVAQVGNLFVLLFILFATFFYRQPLNPGMKMFMGALCVPMSFGGPTVSVNAVTFVSHQLHLPSDAATVFVETMPITRCFQVMLSLVGMTVMVTLLTFQSRGQLHFRPRLARAVPTIVLLLVALVVGRLVIHQPDDYDSKYAAMSVAEVSPGLSAPTLLRSVSRLGSWPWWPDKWRRPKRAARSLADIKTGGVLRIGYNPNLPPFCYFNGAGQLAGYDVAFGCRLALDMGCRAEFRPFERFDDVARELDDGDFDVCMSGLIVTVPRMRIMSFSEPVTSQPLSIVVPVRLAHRVADPTALEGLTIGGMGAFADPIGKRYLGSAHIVDIQREGPQALLDGHVDAIVWSRTQAEVWTSLHPGYVAVTPSPPLATVNFAYAVSRDQSTSVSILNYWLRLKAASGFTERQIHYWIDGESVNALPRRWSVWHDVLHLP